MRPAARSPARAFLREYAVWLHASYHYPSWRTAVSREARYVPPGPLRSRRREFASGPPTSYIWTRPLSRGGPRSHDEESSELIVALAASAETGSMLSSDSFRGPPAVTTFTGNQRFKTLLAESAPSEKATHDQALLCRPDWVLAPSLGAIVPNWFLLIPRVEVLNFRIWSKLRGTSPLHLLRELCAHLNLGEDHIIWFEHGPGSHGSATGCGVDHAHLHILVNPQFTFGNFTKQARQLSDLQWELNSDSKSDPYKTLPTKKSYLIAGSGSQFMATWDVEATGSQFFRRVVARLVNAETSWDYRVHPHTENIMHTIATYRQLEGSMSRGD